MGEDNLIRHFRTSLEDHTMDVDHHAIWTGVVEKRAKQSHLRKLLAVLLIIALGIGTFFYLLPGIQESPDNDFHNVKIQSFTSANENVLAQAIETEAESSKDRQRRYTDKTLSSSEVKVPSKTASRQAHGFVGAESAIKDGIPTSPWIRRGSKLEAESSKYHQRWYPDKTFTSSTVKGVISKVEGLHRLQGKTVGLSSLEAKVPGLPRSFLARSSVDCFSFSKGHPLSLVAYVSYDGIDKSLSSTDPEIQDYLTLRKRTESVLEAYRAGVLLKYSFPSGLYFKGGIEIGRINEQFLFADTNEVNMVLENQLIRIIIEPNGDTTEVYGNATVTVRETKRWEVYNNWTSFNIPLLAGYQRLYNKWAYGIEGGLIFNTSLGFSGMFLDPNGQVIDGGGSFKSTFGLGVMGGATVGYFVLPGLKVFAMPSVQYQLGSVNAASNPVNQRHTHFGIAIGTEMIF